MPVRERVVGVDGYARGWVAVELVDGRFADAKAFRGFPGVRDAFREVACIAVDIPIGGGPRDADSAARLFVGPRWASVFPTPPAEIVALDDYAEAVGRHPSLSRQSFGLFRKMREVAAVPHDEPPVVEVHPEVSFCALKGAHLDEPKKAWNGFMERRRLLAGAGIELPDRLAAELPLIDVLDAAIAAWSARRYVRGEKKSLGEPPAIWY
jgi:predicted RNase H-like nuclease